MGSVKIEHGIIHYYGNRAGKVSEGKAVVDPMFRNAEMENFLKRKQIQQIEWNDGIFDQLAAANSTGVEETTLKKCRIWQLKPEADVRKKFIAYDWLLERFGSLQAGDYAVIFDGKVKTNDLGQLEKDFSISISKGYRGHSLSMSDIVELYDESSSEFYYVDLIGFQKVKFFENDEQTEQVMKL